MKLVAVGRARNDHDNEPSSDDSSSPCAASSLVAPPSLPARPRIGNDDDTTVRETTANGYVQNLSYSYQPVLGLEPLLSLLVVVNESESSASSTTEMGPETENGDTVLIGLELFCELLLELSFGHIGLRRVDHIEDELSALKQPVVHVFARS